MNNMLQEKSIIVNKPQRHAGVYAILNILEKSIHWRNHRLLPPHSRTYNSYLRK